MILVLYIIMNKYSPCFSGKFRGSLSSLRGPKTWRSLPPEHYKRWWWEVSWPWKGTRDSDWGVQASMYVSSMMEGQGEKEVVCLEGAAAHERDCVDGQVPGDGEAANPG